MSTEKTEASLKSAPQLVNIPNTAVHILNANHTGLALLLIGVYVYCLKMRSQGSLNQTDAQIDPDTR